MNVFQQSTDAFWTHIAVHVSPHRNVWFWLMTNGRKILSHNSKNHTEVALIILSFSTV